MKKAINDNTVVRVKVPKHLYEAIQKKLTLKENQKMQTEAGGVEYAWIPAAAAGMGIAASMLKGIVSHMKSNNLKGMKGFMQAYKEVGKDTASGIERSKGVNEAEEAGGDLTVGIKISFKGHDAGDAENLAETYGLEIGGTRIDPNVYGELPFGEISEFVETLNIVHGINDTTLTNYRV